MAVVLTMEVLENEGNALQVTLIPAFENPKVWGIALCDAARLIAAAYSKLEHRPEQEILAEISSLFNAEMDKPSSPLRGSLQQ